MASFALRRFHRCHLSHIGPATISGVVHELTTPVSRPVYLLEQEGFHVIRETRSATDGTYSFPNMEADKQYLVLAVDPNGAYNATIKDRVLT